MAIKIDVDKMLSDFENQNEIDTILEKIELNHDEHNLKYFQTYQYVYFWKISNQNTLK